MRIKVEPKDFFMYAVYFHFNMEHPEVEDSIIQSYLTEHDLVPKRETFDRFDGEDFQVMCFGGCYISSHMSTIAKMQRETVEREHLMKEIERIIQMSEEAQIRAAADSMTLVDLNQIVLALVVEFHRESSFATTPEGRLKVTIEASEIEGRFLQFTR